MKRLYAIFAACLLSLTVMAQQSSLVGTWQLLDSNGFPTTSAKIFMPDGKLLALSFNSDFSNSSVWFMGSYEVLSDTSYREHVLYHSSINYQCDSYIISHQQNDSMRVTQFSTFLPNGHFSTSTGRWKKMNRPMPTYSEEEWQSLYQKSLAEFDRVPKEGQSVEQFAQELYDKAKDYKNAKKLDRTIEALLIRAELDTTNAKWQREALGFYLSNNSAPSIAEKIADRYIRLTEAAAPTPTDTSVVSAYRAKGYLYSYRGNICLEQARQIFNKCIQMETTAGHQPSKDYGLDYFALAMGYMPNGEFDKLYDCAIKCIDIFEKAPDVSDNQKGEAYEMAGIALMNNDRNREAIDMLQKCVTLFNGEKAYKMTNEIYPVITKCYMNLQEKNPKDKKLKKEIEQFMADKIIYQVFEATNKEFNLWGEYIVLEKDDWTIENPTGETGQESDKHHYLLRKGNEYRDINTKEGQSLNTTAHVKQVDAAEKQEIIKQWKEYRKNKK